MEISVFPPFSRLQASLDAFFDGDLDLHAGLGSASTELVSDANGNAILSFVAGLGSGG